jgi:hypothetical protein
MKIWLCNIANTIGKKADKVQVSKKTTPMDEMSQLILSLLINVKSTDRFGQISSKYLWPS